jgi:hypothetical protein
MATASAVPSALYDYSDQTVPRNDAVQRWQTRLDNAIVRYCQTAQVFGNNIEGVTVFRGPGGGFTLGDLLARWLPKARATDSWVHDVGAAFELVNHQSLRLGPGQVPRGSDPYAQVLATTTDESEIDAYVAQIEGDQRRYDAILRAIKDGTDLAAHIEQYGIDDYVWQQIAAHRGDPDYGYFAASLLNSLAQQDTGTHQNYLTMLLVQPTVPGGPPPPHQRDLIDLLTAAYTNGGVDAAATSVLFRVLVGPNTTASMRLRADFFQALDANHLAARNFVDTLTDDQIIALLNGKYHILDPDPAAGFTNDSSRSEAAVIGVLTSGLDSYADDPTLAKAYYDRVSALIRQTTPDNFGLVAGPLENFVGTYVYLTMPEPPSDASPDALVAWAVANTHAMSAEIGRWRDWIFAYEQRRKDARDTSIAWQEFGLGVVTTLVGAVITANPVWGVALGAVSSVATTWVVPWVNDQLWPFTGDPEHDSIAFRHAMAVSLKFVAVVDFINNGQVLHRDGTPVTVPSGEINDVLAHPQNYLVKGSPDRTLDDVLAHIGNTVQEDL